MAEAIGFLNLASSLLKPAAHFVLRFSLLISVPRP
jgi:hypothetical protein